MDLVPPSTPRVRGTGSKQKIAYSENKGRTYLCRSATELLHLVQCIFIVVFVVIIRICHGNKCRRRRRFSSFRFGGCVQLRGGGGGKERYCLPCCCCWNWSVSVHRCERIRAVARSKHKQYCSENGGRGWDHDPINVLLNVGMVCVYIYTDSFRGTAQQSVLSVVAKHLLPQLSLEADQNGDDDTTTSLAPQPEGQTAALVLTRFVDDEGNALLYQRL
jgi:hypothetical protein